MDLLKAEKVLILFDGKVYHARICAIERNEYHLEIIAGNPFEKSVIKRKAEMQMVCDKQRFTCNGFLYWVYPHRVVFVIASSITRQERRSEPRFDVPLLPGKIKEYGFLHLPHEIPVSILNLSKHGVCFESRHNLSKNKKYHLEVGLGLLNSPDFIVRLSQNEQYLTVIEILDIKQVQNLIVYKAKFIDISPEYQKTIGRFIEKLEMESLGELRKG